MPRFAVMTFMFSHWWRDGRVSHESILQAIAESGADGVEPFQQDFIDDPALIPRYQRALSDNSLAVAAVDVICNLVYANRNDKTRGHDDLRRGLDITHALGSQIAHVAGNRLVDGVSAGDGRKMIADGLLAALDYARSAGITMAIENFHPAPDLMCSAADCLEIIHLTGDQTGFVFDTGNFIAVQEDAATVFESLAGHIRHCHFKDCLVDSDNPRGFRECDLGQGDIPNPKVATLLKDRGYDQWVALETYGRADLDPVSAIRKEFPVLQSWFA